MELKTENCRKCRDRDINKRADFIVWGKFFEAEDLGPVCTYDLPKGLPLHRIGQYAIYDLRPVNTILDAR